MKMVKSLLLGSAAGLVAVTAGQAADLPVKAKPVEYVKVCSLYGAGFYYMPGTDMCIKIGGWVRSEVTWGINGNSTTGIFGTDLNNRTTNNFWSRERGYITADAREQTAYGVARGYIAVGISSQNTGSEANSGSFSANRAFVQWAGMTAGLSVSFFDFYPAAAMLYRAGNVPSEDTGDGGQWIWAYTAQMGNGVSATISAEERRDSQIVGFSGAAAPAVIVGTVTAVGATSTGYGGWQSPDVVANLRVDQAWGSAQVMGAAHELNPLYYTPGAGTTVSSGHASDSWGWVFGAGLRINTPFISQGDYFVAEANVTQGATRYLWNGAGNVGELGVSGATEGFGVGSDCVYAGTAAGPNTGCLKTSAWSVNAAYEHYWTPQWHQDLVGVYLKESYGSQANALLCAGQGNSTGSFVAGTLAAGAGCNNNWSVYGVGSRLQWDVTKSFYLGVEVLYEYLQTATLNAAGSAAAVAPAGSGAINTGNISNWTVTVRMHKDFLP
jgi:hypothetical protein